jgi:hypothetical protein
MWKLEKRKYHLKYQHSDREVWLDKETLVGDDGISIMAVAGAPAGFLEFLYSDNKVSFRFLATRFDTSSENKPPTTTWTVLLGSALNGLEKMQRTPVTPERAREIADNITDGMLAWPIHLHFAREPLPAGAVRFRMNPWFHWSPALGWGE